MSPYITEGGIVEDVRGSIAFVNDFSFENIHRFYIIENAEDNDTRAWHGHKRDIKNFYCVQGSFLISYVKIDDWDSPSKKNEPESVILTSSESKILTIPAGYANSVKSLEVHSKLISFSTLPISETKDDSVRYDKTMWIIP